MTIPTPGAASELLPCPFCGSPAARETCQRRHEFFDAVECTNDLCGVFIVADENDQDEVKKWNTRTPAPVMEGAQREAVAWLRYRDYNGTRPTSIHVCNPDDDGAFAVYRHSLPNRAVTEEDVSRAIRAYADKGGMHPISREAMRAAISASPPPPDRVQPERGDDGPMLDTDETPRMTRTPTDASGGVTESCTHCGRNRVVGEGRLPEWPQCCGLVCHCTCHNDPLYCRECKDCSCHKN